MITDGRLTIAWCGLLTEGDREAVRHGARDAARGVRFLHGRGRGLTPTDLPQVTRMLALSGLSYNLALLSR